MDKGEGFESSEAGIDATMFLPVAKLSLLGSGFLEPLPAVEITKAILGGTGLTKPASAGQRLGRGLPRER